MPVISRERVLDTEGGEWLFEFEKDSDGWRHFITSPDGLRRQLVRRKNPSTHRPSVDSETPLPLDLS